MTLAVSNTPLKILIVGFGDIGRRVARTLSRQYRVSALIRNPSRTESALECGVTPYFGDLADPQSLALIDADVDTVFHFAPPPTAGEQDQHTRNLVTAIARLTALRRVIYISTTGVYGDCEGRLIDETEPLNPQSERAKRRVDAESVLTDWATRHQGVLSVLRAPGIYAADRLPFARLKALTPAIVAGEDAWSNHIHAEDLAAACVLALRRTQSGVFNIVDDSEMKMGDYFDLVADHFKLARPPRITRREAERVIAAPMLSFMRESRRIQNKKVKADLGLALRYPTVRNFLATLPD